MKNNYYDNLKTTIEAIHNAGITSLQELQNDILLYHTFFLVLNDYIGHVVLSVKGKYDKNTDKFKSGNKERLFILNSYNFSNEDIQGDILIHLIKKGDLYLSKPSAEMQISYINKTCVNYLNDLLRKHKACYSLDTPLNNSSVSDDDIVTMMELLPDNHATYLPEECLEAKEEVLQRYQDLNNAIKLLHNYPAEMLCYLSLIFLNTKPRELTKFLINIGHINTIIVVLSEISKTYNLISTKQIKNNISSELVEFLVRKLPTNTEEKALSRQISRLAYRGKDILNEKRNKQKTR